MEENMNYTDADKIVQLDQSDEVCNQKRILTGLGGDLVSKNLNMFLKKAENTNEEDEINKSIDKSTEKKITSSLIKQRMSKFSNFEQNENPKATFRRVNLAKKTSDLINSEENITTTIESEKSAEDILKEIETIETTDYPLSSFVGYMLMTPHDDLVEFDKMEFNNSEDDLDDADDILRDVNSMLEKNHQFETDEIISKNVVPLKSTTSRKSKNKVKQKSHNMVKEDTIDKSQVLSQPDVAKVETLSNFEMKESFNLSKNTLQKNHPKVTTVNASTHENDQKKDMQAIPVDADFKAKKLKKKSFYSKENNFKEKISDNITPENKPLKGILKVHFKDNDAGTVIENHTVAKPRNKLSNSRKQILDDENEIDKEASSMTRSNNRSLIVKSRNKIYNTTQYRNWTIEKANKHSSESDEKHFNMRAKALVKNKKKKEPRNMYMEPDRQNVLADKNTNIQKPQTIKRNTNNDFTSSQTRDLSSLTKLPFVNDQKSDKLTHSVDSKNITMKDTLYRNQAKKDEEEIDQNSKSVTSKMMTVPATKVAPSQIKDFKDQMIMYYIMSKDLKLAYIMKKIDHEFIGSILNCSSFYQSIRENKLNVKEHQILLNISQDSHPYHSLTYKKNITLTRNLSSVPYDHNRVKILNTFEDSPKNDYICASFIRDNIMGNSIIMAQTPILQTCETFWKMIYERNSGAIFCLSDYKDQNFSFCKYWPSKTNDKKYKQFNVIKLEKEKKDLYSVRKFSIIPIMSCQRTMKVTQFALNACSNAKKNIKGLNHLVHIARMIISSTNHQKLVVHCLDGNKLSAVFIGNLIMRTSINDRGVFSPFLTALTIKMQYMNCFENLAHYNLLYKMIAEYLCKKYDYDESELSIS